MIDPFFLDRLMHAFTTANATPLAHAAAHAAAQQPIAAFRNAAPICRALREAEDVAAAAFRRQEATSAESPRDDRHAG